MKGAKGRQPRPRKTATNMSVRSERAAWLAENQDAIDDHNTQVARRGVFGDDWRRF